MYLTHNYLVSPYTESRAFARDSASHFFVKITFLLICCCVSSAIALKKDNAEKIFIMCDSALLNYKTGTHTFLGNVKVDQGTTHVTADRMQTNKNNLHQINIVTAFGLQTLAHYWTLPRVGDSEIHAYAKIIKYFPLSSNTLLEQKGLIMQGKNSFQGEKIFYNMHQETITVPAYNESNAVFIYDPDSN